MMILMRVVWGGPSSDGGGDTNVAQKHASSLRERERDKRHKTHRERPRTDVQRSSQNARAQKSSSTRVVSSLQHKEHTPTFWSFFQSRRRRPTKRKEERKDQTKEKKRDQKTLQKKDEREEKRYDTGDREREREGAAAAPKNTHDFENDFAKEKEQKKKKKKKKN